MKIQIHINIIKQIFKINKFLINDNHQTYSQTKNKMIKKIYPKIIIIIIIMQKVKIKFWIKILFRIKDNFIVNKLEKLVNRNNLILTDFYHKLKINSQMKKNNVNYSNFQKINLSCLN